MRSVGGLLQLAVAWWGAAPPPLHKKILLPPYYYRHSNTTTVADVNILSTAPYPILSRPIIRIYRYPVQLQFNFFPPDYLLLLYIFLYYLYFGGE